MAPFARKLAILRQSKQDAELAPIGARDDLFIGSIGAAATSPRPPSASRTS